MPGKISGMKLSRVIETSASVAGTSSRSAKVSTLAHMLQETVATHGRGHHCIEVVADYVAGTLPQRRVGVSWRGLRDLPQPATQATLTIEQTDTALTVMAELSGGGSASKRRKAIKGLFGRATVAEQRWLAALITGDLRQGASDGVLLQAIAQAAGIDDHIVRAAVMRAGYPGPVARVALSAPNEEAAMAALTAMTLRVGRPLRPMLSGSAPTVEDALHDERPVALECKVDGIRIQAHLWDSPSGREVHIFTRTLDEITDRVPEVVEALKLLPTRAAVLDGEIIALRPDGRPEPFQVTGARTASSANPEELREQVPLTTYLFDAMHRGGTDLIDMSNAGRWQVLNELAPHLLVPRIVTADPSAARLFFEEQVAAGHEGVIVKALDAPYMAGRRGEGWVKVKPRHTLDLVVTAVEWGSGRRQGMLSNIHLAARNEHTDDLVMLGKTFKGMTDEMLRWQTERFLGLETRRSGHVVFVRPEQVVEIAVDGVQRSRRYPGGIALRFARVLRYRDDKAVHDIDSLQTVIATLGGGLAPSGVEPAGG
ncbi:MAG: ATP-dependent DNA ligase [Ornithinimicrobium sp.]